MPTLLTENEIHRTKLQTPPAAANVCDFLLLGKNKDRAALLALDQTYTYGELQSASRAVASYLVEHGGRKGDRVLLIGDNSFFWVGAYLGTLKAGMVCVPLPPNTSADSLEHIIDLTEPRFGFVQNKIATQRGDQLAGILLVIETKSTKAGTHKTSFETLLSRPESNVPLPPTKSNDLAALVFTSGSTGKPRGVMISHGNIIANTNSIIEYLALSPDDRIMAVLPFFYCFGASLLHTHLRAGGSIVLDSRFMYPDKVLQRMAETECTGFAGVPSHFQILLRKSSLPRMSFPHLRYVQQAGGHLAPVFVRELAAALPKTKIFLMYGQTEATARLSYLPPDHVLTRSGSIGKAIPGVTLRVITASGKEVQPGDRHEGEIIAEGENVALGYWRDEAATAATFANGRLRTGDIGAVDRDGFFHLVDRTRDFVKCGGERVSCQALEERLLEFDGLLEAAVIGVPDDVLGEAIKVFVVPRDAAANHLEERLLEFCRQNIPNKLMPKSIVVRKSLPKNGAGKVLKPELRRL